MKIMLYRFLRCRLTFKLYVILTIIAIVSVFAYLFPQYRIYPENPATVSSNVHPRPSRHVSKLLTVVFRQFEEFDNDVADSVQSFVSAFPNMPVVVVSESTPYPPFPFSASNETLRNVKVVSLELRLNASPRELKPLSYVSTEFVLFVPDATRAVRRTLQAAAAAITTYPTHAIAIGVGSSRLICQQVKWKYEDWTLQYSKDVSGKLCDAVHGQHALLLRTALLHTLPDPFTLPFPEALYLQSVVKNVKVQILDSKLGIGRSVLKSPAAKQKASRHMRDHRVALYKQLGVKAVVREDGRVQWFGCKRETQRCFPAVQGTPSYILSGRNTPPCCRRNMRRAAGHVLRALLQAGARCWLETTSLLGAVIRGDLLPWAEYVEIGIHASDVSRVTWLQRGGADTDGFVWERATKGHYYRVAYSATNRIYVLVLPFAARNGTMYPADWVLAHQREFPERHLHPLAQIQFAGREAPAPNDARAFLDLKLGASAVERCDKIGPKLLYP
ncbi:ribitol 5-phosphate transferase FKRP [Pectinophora gossypiella]|uniref:ribitol 5-phosphate transferase FKRP n=1 Tax=Pectinophora gossypiella TaxID=13191 RepID=UPI00214E5439|nr:ribitol 5-phosphate transferase FKRP [Pectinophora gossypiella]